MSTILLHPINHGFDNDSNCGMEMWKLIYPSHLKALLISEYRWLREEGVSRRVARWHVHRMLSMMWRTNVPGAPEWSAELAIDEEDHIHDGYCDVCDDPNCDQYDYYDPDLD